MLGCMAAQMIFSFVVAIIAAAVTASADLSSIASLDTSRVLSGEVWRLLTGHITHLTWRQYAVDATAFVFLYATYSRMAGSASSVSLALFSALAVSAAVIFTGMHQVYGGLSGLSCAALSAILITSIMEHPRQITLYLVGFAYCAYLLFIEGIASDVNVAGEAHIAGAILGVVFVLMWRNKGAVRKRCQQLSWDLRKGIAA
jgi:membrane associated rhomboid family serine protease